MKTFGELPEGANFYRGDIKTLVWQKAAPFTAYGTFKQNASAYGGYWHYDLIDDSELVTPTDDPWVKP